MLKGPHDQTQWLDLIGIGEDGLSGLSDEARNLVEQADVVIGGKRHLDIVGDLRGEKIPWPAKMQDMFAHLRDYKGRPVVILASGDPLHYGAGSSLTHHLDPTEFRIWPTLSSYTMACARMGWARADVDCITVHGRPVERALAWLQPGRKTINLCADRTTPAKLAALLTEHGFGRTMIHAFSLMGGAREDYTAGLAKDWAESFDHDLITLAYIPMADDGAQVWPRGFGLPDDAFLHDGQITKSEVRAMTMSVLAPTPGDLLWDLGAGSGSVSVEWMRAEPTVKAIAVEQSDDRIAMLTRNCAALGVPDVKIIHGKIPDALDGLDRPDAIFVGGGITAPDLLDRCLAALQPGGRLVANTVTLESTQVLLHWAELLDGAQVKRITVERSEGVGRFTALKPLMTVTQLVWRKSWGSHD